VSGVTAEAREPQGFRGPVGRRHPVAAFLAWRLLAGAGTLFVVSVLVFAATQILPGDAASAILGRQASGEQLAELRREMGLDRPLVERYGDWVGGLLSGDLGNSAAGYAAGAEIPIWSLIGERIANTSILAAIAFALAVPISLALGVLAAIRAGSLADQAITVTSLGFIALPEFVLGSILILIFFSWLRWLPPLAAFSPGESPLSEPKALVLPVLTLLGVTVGAAVRMVRAGMLEALNSDYVQMARLHGLPEGRVRVRYALRNALAPSVQVFAYLLQYLLGGIVVVEYLFAYPGLGKALVDAVAIRDTFEVQAIAVLFAAAFIAINILADLLVLFLVPRLRTAQ
jgi:peptide/nickel transport system permease protein